MKPRRLFDRIGRKNGMFRPAVASKVAECMRARWATPDYRDAMTKAAKGKRRTVAQRLAMSARMKRHHRENPRPRKVRAALSPKERKQRRLAGRAQAGATIKANWNDPQRRDAMLAKLNAKPVWIDGQWSPSLRAGLADRHIQVTDKRLAKLRAKVVHGAGAAVVWRGLSICLA